MTLDEILVQANVNWDLQKPSDDLSLAKATLFEAKKEAQHLKELVDEMTRRYREAEKKCQLAQANYDRLVEVQTKNPHHFMEVNNTTDALQKTVASKTGKKSPRDPSPYNVFMKTEMTRLKKAEPGLDHKDAFKQAAANWKFAKENLKGVELKEEPNTGSDSTTGSTGLNMGSSDVEVLPEDVFV
ncbi:MAG: hypothetical protein ACYCQJ_15485 [Nitrososphaerales archaeon]